MMGIFGMALMALGFSSCSGGSGDAEQIALEGGSFIHHIKTGNPVANPGDFIFFHAYIRNGDSLVFTTREQGDAQFFQLPSEAQPGRPSHPVEQGLALMGAGDSATVVINIDTLPQKPPGFENASEVFYDIAVTEIVTEEAYKKKKKEEMAEALDGTLQTLIDEHAPGAAKEPLLETESGLQYLLIEQGDGKKPQPGQEVKVNYHGVLMDGTTFDSSFSRGEPIAFPIGQRQVIPGWDEGIALLNEGGKAILVIPPDLGYGQRGAPPVIPPDAYLAFYVELVEVGE